LRGIPIGSANRYMAENMSKGFSET